MLQDKLVEGTGSLSPGSLFKGFRVGPRFYSIKVRQGPCITGKEFQTAYEFIGIPVEENLTKEIIKDFNLSNNYGVIYFPKFRLGEKSSKAIIKEDAESYIIKGILPDKKLKWEMILREHLLEDEGILYCSREDFEN